MKTGEEIVDKKTSGKNVPDGHILVKLARTKRGNRVVWWELMSKDTFDKSALSPGQVPVR